MNNNQRRIHYLDHSIQKWLLVALVAMEVMLVAIAMWMSYEAFSDVVDQEIYHVHFAGQPSAFGRLLDEGMKILGMFLLVNLAMLVLADRIWAYRVNGVLRSLMVLVDASLQLDFSKKNHVPCNHDVLMHAVMWRDAELLRIKELRQDIHALPATLPETAEERQNVAAGLKKVLAALPAD